MYGSRMCVMPSVEATLVKSSFGGGPPNPSAW